jgi:sigma-B regulation protein RsbU (phosphoserine phosphatase)
MTSPAVSPQSDVSAEKASRALYALLDLARDLGSEFSVEKLLEVIANKARDSEDDDALMRALTDLDHQRYEQSLRLAGEIQMRMLPSGTVVLPDKSPFAIHAFIRPARQIGGDLYDFFWNDESLSFCIGDVTGKGIGAALVMAMTKTLLRAYSVFQYDPARLMSAVNARLSEETDPSMFVTAFCGLLDLRTGRLLYSNAGHEPPLIVRAGKPVERLISKSGIPLGALRSFKYVVEKVMLEPGDAVLLFTDGVTEAANRSQELFSTQRLREVVDRCGASDPSYIVSEVVESVDEFAGGTPQSDDIAMVCVQFRGVPQQVSATFRRDIGELSKIFDLIGDFFDARPVEDAVKNAMELAAEEIFTNCVRHSTGEDRIEVRLRLDGNDVSISVTDFGAPPFDIDRDVPEADVHRPLAERKPGGLGVFLVKTMMDRVESSYDEGSSTVTLYKRVK